MYKRQDFYNSLRRVPECYLIDKNIICLLYTSKKDVRLILDKESETAELNVAQPAKLELSGKVTTLSIAKNGGGSRCV